MNNERYKISVEFTEGVMIATIVAYLTPKSGVRILAKELASLNDEVKELTEKKIKQSKSFWDRYIVDIDYNENGLTAKSNSKFKITCYLKPIEINEELIDEVESWFVPKVEEFKSKYELR